MAKFLGIDCCTRKMNAQVIDTEMRSTVAAASVSYSDLRDSSVMKDGVIPVDDPLVKHSDPLMWSDALDAIFAQLKLNGYDLSEIDGISGCAQQHGTVYLSRKFVTDNWLKADSSSLSDSISGMLTRSSSPIWMDSSTFEECRQLDEYLGGSANMRQISGSPATERFAAAQIKRFSTREPSAYEETGVIHLVSSFLCSLLIGKSTAIDSCDAAGMNLMNLEELRWDSRLMDAAAPNLKEKLPPICGNSNIAGTLHPYFKRYGLREIPVVSWTGDNPSCLVGTGCYKSGTFVIALGTSDNFFCASDKFLTDAQGYGHLFLNPAGKYMPLACFKNGSFAREMIRRKYDLTEEQFNAEAFELTRPGNNGNILLPYVTDEITPQAMNVGGIVFEGNSLFKSQKDAAVIVRALVEAQALTMKLHTGWFGHKIRSIRVTGASSESYGICQVLADVFNTSVERLSNNNAASQGSAMRAAQAISPDDFTWSSLTKIFCAPNSKKTVDPIKQNIDVYRELLLKYAELEKSITGVECPYIRD